MAVMKDSSIVVDSTVDSSSSPPMPVKRAARTYGKPRDSQPSLDTTSFPSSSGSTSRLTILPTGPKHILEEIPPTSDPEDASPKFKFEYDWKNALRDIDDADDDDLSALTGSMGAIGAGGSASSQAGVSSDNLMGGPSPVHPSPPIKRRVKPRRAVIADSKSDSPSRSQSPENPSQSLSQSSPTSPEFPHTITTPVTHTNTSTPPTSDPDCDNDLPSVGKMLKGKDKANRDVQPLKLLQGDLSDSGSKPTAKLKGKRRQTRSKVKAPTKKEKRATTMETARITADQPVIIEHTELHNYSRVAFFNKIKQNNGRGNKRAPPPAPSSDPIQQFSSPSFGKPSLLATTTTLPTTPALTPVAEVHLSDEEDLPTMGTLHRESQTKPTEVQRKRHLAEVKRRALAERGEGNDESDDDLEIVKDDKYIAKGSIKKQRCMDLGSSRAEGAKASTFEVLRLARSTGRKMKQEQWNKDMLGKVMKDQEREIKKREEEWRSGGGKVMTGDESMKGRRGIEEVFEEYAEKGVLGNVMKAEEEEKEDDGSDEEWVPEGSASPEPHMKEDEIPQPASEIGARASPQSVDMDTGHQSGTETLDDEPSHQCEDDEMDDETFQPRGPRRGRVIVDSDDEDADVENFRHGSFRHQETYGRILVPDTSLSINFDEPSLPNFRRDSTTSLGTSEETENENDKENDTRRMWDKSEDKENKAVVRHSPFASGGSLCFTDRGSLFELEEDLRRGLSMSPGISVDEDQTESGENARKPFKVLKEDEGDDPFVVKSTFTQRLASTSQSQHSLSPTLVPTSTAFSQFSDDADELNEIELFKPKALESGLAQLFGAGTVAEHDNCFEPPLSENQPLVKLRAPADLHDLPLTLDVGLAPPLEVNEYKRRQADSIFEKEQEYLVEGHNRRPVLKEELYVNDHGFLTQTRPDEANPEVYTAMSPSQTQTQAKGFFISQQPTQIGAAVAQPSTQAIQRRPLGTISLSSYDMEQEASHQPLRRLKKRDASPDFIHPFVSSPSFGRHKPNAFEFITHNAKIKAARERKKLEKSEFIEGEAEESDDDEMRGFGGFGKAKGDGEEEGEEGDDLDKTLEGLVDDKEMNEEEIARQAVLEKHHEHVEQDDQALEKLHKDAVDGKLRVKRRNRGIGLDVSDDDDDDDSEHVRAIRRRMFKKRKIDGDDLDALGENEETLPFYNTYQRGLADDEDDKEFAYLHAEDIVMADGDDKEEEEQEFVSTHEIVRQLREVAQRHQDDEPLDTNDVSWLDQDNLDIDLDDDAQIKAVSFAIKKPVRQRPVDVDEMERPRQSVSDAAEIARLDTWAKLERKTNNVGTGRSAVGAAVTGHGKPKVKAGGGSLRPGAVAGSGSRSERRHVVKAASLLAKVSDRSNLFA